MDARTSNIPSLQVHYDLGLDSERPAISRQGIIILSVLLGLYLSALFGTTIYATSVPRWTEKLDAFAMMRLGASIPNKVPLRIVDSADQEPALDETPGWVGDAKGDKEFGCIGLGGASRLGGARQFESYQDSPPVHW